MGAFTIDLNRMPSPEEFAKLDPIQQLACAMGSIHMFRNDGGDPAAYRSLAVMGVAKCDRTLAGIPAHLLDTPEAGFVRAARAYFAECVAESSAPH